MNTNGHEFDLSLKAKAFKFFLDKIESGTFKKTKTGLAINSAMEATYIDADTIKFLARYTDIGVTHIGVVDVHDLAGFERGSKKLFECTTNLSDSIVKTKAKPPLSHFVGLLPSATDPSGWVNVAMEIEGEINQKLVFIIQTYETAAGQGSTCFVGGTAWIMPSDCGRPSLKAWLDHVAQLPSKHESISVPAISVSSTVYRRVTEKSVQPLSSMRKKEQAISKIQTRGEVCEAAGWTNRGIDPLFQQEVWVKDSNIQTSKGRRVMLSTVETTATIKKKVSACRTSGGVVIVDADMDINCENEHGELLNIAKEECQSGK